MGKRWRWAAAIVLGGLWMSSSLQADPLATFTLTGAVGSHVTLSVLGLDPSNTKSLFSDVTGADFSNGYVGIANAIQLRNVNSNKPVYLKIRNTGWTLPAEYDTTAGPKKADGSDSEFQIQVNGTTLTATAGTFAILGSYGTSYVGVNNTAAQFLKLGQITGGGKKQGLRNGSADIDAKINLNPVYDVPGNYAVVLELTIADQ